MFEWLIALAFQLVVLGSVKVMFKKLLLDKEMDYAGNCREKCF